MLHVGVTECWQGNARYWVNWATTLGGSGEETGVGVWSSPEPEMNLFVVANTNSGNVSSYSNQGGWDILVAKYSSDGSRLALTGLRNFHSFMNPSLRVQRDILLEVDYYRDVFPRFA
jgi:hypothetical protein